MRTVLELARQAGELLVGRGFEKGRLDAELLLASVLGMKRLDLYLQYDRPVSEAELARFRAAVRRRLRKEPIQYIVGDTQFRELLLRVDRRVLIPRPETEQLVGAVLRRVEGRTGLTALDLGTGSGAIALSLAAEAGDAFVRIVATDVSAGAIEVAQANADRLGLAGRVEFRVGDLWSPLADERFDVIVSNPPYVAESEAETLAPEVLEWEPGEALFAGAAGTDILFALGAEASARLEEGGLLALEVGPGQAALMARRLSESGFRDCRVEADLAGRDRIVIATRDNPLGAADRPQPEPARQVEQETG